MKPTEDKEAMLTLKEKRKIEPTYGFGMRSIGEILIDKTTTAIIAKLEQLGYERKVE